MSTGHRDWALELCELHEPDRKHLSHEDCIAEQIARPERDGIDVRSCMTVSFDGREVDVFVRFRIVSNDGAPEYEVEEVCDDKTGEPVTLSQDELIQIEEHLVEDAT